MSPFGGWDMPLSYPSGTLAEHRACREAAVMFDVSHLGTVRVAGADAFDRVQATLTNDLSKVRPGRAQYTHLLDPADGSVSDDIIVWWVDEDTFDVMPNASNTDGVVAALGEGAVDVTETRAVLALQGPAARRLLAQVWPEAAQVARFDVARLEWNGHPGIVAGTGYSGEDGVEVAVPNDVAVTLWNRLSDVGFVPAGLGARDTLRLEAGLPLHGHELGPGITPLQAGLGWVVAWDKPTFVGKAPLEAERARGPHRRLRALTVETRRPPRAGQGVLVDEKVVGEVSSGNFSPTLGKGIALAFVSPDLSIGDSVAIDVRGDAVPAQIVKPPFVAPTPAEPVQAEA